MGHASSGRASPGCAPAADGPAPNTGAHPGALSPAANADIVAFLLKSNDIPSGSKELSPESLKAINFDSAVSRRARN